MAGNADSWLIRSLRLPYRACACAPPRARRGVGKICSSLVNAVIEQGGSLLVLCVCRCHHVNKLRNNQPGFLTYSMPNYSKL